MLDFRRRGGGEVAAAQSEADRLRADVATYRHAFETTAQDRDRWAARARELEAAVADARLETNRLREENTTGRLAPIDLAFQHHLARRLRIVQVVDYLFLIDVVGTCNLRCPSCAVGNSPAQLAKGLMSRAAFEAVLSKIKAEYGEYSRILIHLFNWGEPSLHPDLSKLVGSAKRAGFGVGLSSNLNEFPDLREVIKSEPDFLRISFSGMRAANYGATHRGGRLFALKANMYRVRDLIDRYGSKTVVQGGFHLYRRNFPDDFLAARALCDELGFLFEPVVASLMPAEKLVSVACGEGGVETDLASNFILPMPDLLALLRKAGPATTDCAMRRNRVTINYDGSVSLCCATYDRDKIIVDDFLTASRSTVDAAKYAHPFCETCMMLHVNKVYTVMNRTQQNEAAAEILGPIFQMYVNESRLIGDPDVVVLDNVFEAKTHVFERGMAALSCGEAGWDEAERCFTALVKGAPDFAEGFFQAARLARARGQFGTARSHAAEAVRLHPGHQVYLEFAGDLSASSS